MIRGEIRKVLQDPKVQVGFEIECIFPSVFRNEGYKTKPDISKIAYSYFKAPRLPFDYVIKDYHHYYNKKKWIIKSDNSVGDAGLELVSPVMPLKEYLEICPFIFSHMKKVGAVTDNKCGFHLGISLKDRGWYNKIDVMKLGLFVDENEIYEFFPMRKNNTFCESVHKDIKKVFRKRVGDFIVENYKVKPVFSENHYMGINLQHLKGKNKYIEFRYIGGRDYHKKWKEIKYLTAKFILAIRKACDENTDYEYILKVRDLRRGN
jgi:hypothetical protein